MSYLNYSNLPAFIERYFSKPGMREQRLVGIEHVYDSGYYDVIRFFGGQPEKPGNITIAYLPNSFTFTDPNIREFATHAEQRLRLEGRLYEGPGAVRVVGLDLNVYPQTMTVQECAYGDQAGTCFALDLPHPVFRKWGGTLREYYKARYPSNALGQNPLAICLGICGFLTVKEGDSEYLLQVHRTAKLASLEDSLGPSVAGSVDYVSDYSTLQDIINRSLGAEIEEELHLESDETQIVPLAYAREIFRGEKPQIFCLVTTTLNRKQIAERLDGIDPEAREFDHYEFVTVHSKRHSMAHWLESLNHEARMNYYLLEEYFESSQHS